MTDCEICGDEEAEYNISIEGAALMACLGCSKMGKILAQVAKIDVPPALSGFGFSSFPARPQQTMPGAEEPEIIENYAELIQKAMARLKLSAAVLSERLNEKESFIKRIESGGATPTTALARKLQDELDTNLFGSGGGAPPQNFGGRKSVTMADLIDFGKD